jgi:prepilin-type processing-associated H-X9-DG protein
MTDVSDAMNPHDMLDFGLGQLDAAAFQRVEHQREADPGLAAQLERLQMNLRLMLDDGPGPEPPDGLARRTIERVEKRRRWRAVLDYAPPRAPFRLADFAVAASIFCAGILTLLPAIRQSQWAARTASCASNLHKIGVGLIRYAANHGAYPYADGDDPAPYAATYAMRMKDSGLIDDDGILDCPSNGLRPFGDRRVPSYSELISYNPDRARSVAAVRDSDYAYNIGYTEQGRPHALPVTIPAHVPLLADGPAFTGAGKALKGNSRNHGGMGQNVLFAGGHVQFLRSPRHDRDADIFHNRLQHTAPGLDLNDFVLAPGPARFDGK